MNNRNASTRWGKKKALLFRVGGCECGITASPSPKGNIWRNECVKLEQACQNNEEKKNRNLRNLGSVIEITGRGRLCLFTVSCGASDSCPYKDELFNTGGRIACSQKCGSKWH
jgi:hypothetical protein